MVTFLDRPRWIPFCSLWQAYLL